MTESVSSADPPHGGPDRIITLVAGIVSALFALLHLSFAVTVVPQFQELYAELSGTLPILTRAVVGLGSLGLALVLLVVDTLVFLVMYRLARRHWFGLVFVPPVIYIAMISLLVVIVYLPMQNIINLVR